MCLRELKKRPLRFLGRKTSDVKSGDKKDACEWWWGLNTRQLGREKEGAVPGGD